MTPTNKYLLCRQLYIFSISKRRFFYYYSVTHIVNNDDYFIKVGQYKLYQKKNIYTYTLTFYIFKQCSNFITSCTAAEQRDTEAKCRKHVACSERQQNVYAAKFVLIREIARVKKNPRLLNDDTLLA